MTFDPENAVVKLCTAGMQAEAEGEPERARALFRQAWEAAESDYDACIAALPGSISDNDGGASAMEPNGPRTWKASVDERANAFFPSPYLCIGRDHEETGSRAEAAANYREAANWVSHLPDGEYGEMLKKAVLGCISVG